MKDTERFKLLGKYTTPRVRMGSVITCEYRDCDVTVVGYSNGRIPWPLGRKRGAGSIGGFIVYGALADAIRTESNLAVAFRFGVSRPIVTKWRQAFGVGYTTEGTRKLQQGYSREDWFKEFRLAGVAKSQDPERRRKLSASRNGKKLSPSHVEAIRRGLKSMSAEARANISAAQKERAKRVVNYGQIFTPKHDRIIRTYSTAEAARLTDRSPASIYSRRRRLGLAKARK